MNRTAVRGSEGDGEVIRVHVGDGYRLNHSGKGLRVQGSRQGFLLGVRL